MKTQSFLLGRAPWLAVGGAGLLLLALPGAGLVATAGEASPAVPGWLRLGVGLPVLAAGLGVAPVRLARLEGGLPAVALGATAAPLAWAALGAAALSAGRDFGAAGRLALLFAAGLAAACALFEPRAARPTAAAEARAPRAFVLAAALLAGGTAALLLLNPALAHRSDAWFHAAVVYRMDLLGWPPDDPYYVGVPLGYAWAFHLALGTLAGAAGVTPFAAGAAVSAMAALAVALWLGLLARRLCGAAAMAAAPALAVVALNPLGWMGWLFQGLTGGERGAQALARAWQGGALGALRAIDLRYPHPSAGYFLDKFLLVTALGLGYAALLAFAWALSGSGERRAATFGTAALAAAAGLFLHGVAGVALVLAGALALAGSAALARGRGVLLPAAAGLAAAAAVAWPYARLCSAGRAQVTARPGFQPDMLWTWVASGGLLLALAAPELARWWRARRADPGPARVGLLWLALLVLSLAVTLAGRNETKIFNLGVALLAVPAAGGWVGARRGRAVARLAVLVLGVPTFVLGLSGFVLERGQDVRGAPVPAAPEAEAYRWLATHADPRAALIEAPQDAEGHVQPDALVHARRGLVWGGPEYARVWGYAEEEGAERLRLARALGAGEFSPRLEAALVRLGALGASEFYFLRRAPAGAGPALPGPWEPVFASRALTVFRYGAGEPQLAAAERP